MIKKVIPSYNLYGESDKSVIPDFVHCETIEVRSKAHDWEIKPHIHTQLYQVFLFEIGNGYLLLDKQQIRFDSPCIITIPANHLHGFHYEGATDGRVITLSDTYLDTIFNSSPKVILPLHQITLIPILEEKASFEELIRLIDQISAELYEDFLEKKMAIQMYLSLFFIKIFRFTKQNEKSLQNDNRQLKHFREFQKNIRKSLSALKTVTEYAQELNITTVHLNRICQAVAQKSASQLAEEYIIQEARKYLTHTSYSISEISYMLDFNDPAYFSRLFKRHTGISPKGFREE